MTEREAFEAWAKDEFYSGLASVSDTWDEKRNCYTDFAHHMAFNAFKYARAAVQANVPDGWVLVPVEPTDEMVVAGKNECGEEVFSPSQVKAVWRDMLSAIQKG